jgi:phage-related minor tail protein
MAAITITNPLPQVLVALSQEAIDRVDTLVEQSIALGAKPLADLDAYNVADALHRSLHEMERELEKQRQLVKAPVLDLGRQIDTAAKAQAEALVEAKRRVAVRVREFQDAENRRREEERRKAEQAAREEEQRRLAELEAKRAQQAADAEWEAPPGEEPAKPEAFDGEIVRPVAPAPTAAPLKSSVRKQTVKRLVIDDASKIPREINGAVLLVPDEKQITLLLRANVAVPGCRLIEEEVLGAAGGKRGA